MPQRGERTPNAVIARTPIDIREVVGMDIKRLKGSTVLFRPPLEKRIEDCFPCGSMNSCRIGQNKIEDHRVEIVPIYPHWCLDQHCVFHVGSQRRATMSGAHHHYGTLRLTQDIL